ncbi:MAG TPA: hypothetical protein ENJ93_00695, partial [Chloroflexi bacterium]|nr:hypothetical protein [Chloroflexota bacterium]
MSLASVKQWFFRHKRGIFVWGGLIIVTLLFLGGIAANVSPALRGPDDWRWTYAVPGAPGRHLLPAAVILAYVVVVFLWGRKLLQTERPSPWLLRGYLLYTAAAIPIIQLSLLAAESPDVVEQLYFRTISWGSSGFFSVGSIIDDGRSFLADYPALMPQFPVHPQRYPPGIPLTFYLSRSLFALWPGLAERVGANLRLYQCQDLTLMRIANPVMATAVIQMALPLIGGLIIFPLFGLARRAFNRRAAVWTVAFYPLLPSFALWAGRWDQFHPLLSVTAWYLFYVGLTRQRRWLILAAGLVVSLASFLSFGLLALLVPMGLWALLWLAVQRNGRSLASIFIDGAIFTGGLLAVW